MLFFTLQIAHSKRDLSLVLVRATHAYGSPRRNADAVTLFWPFQVQMCSLSLLFASDNGQARDSDLTTAVECMCNALRTRPDSFRAHGSTTRTRLLLVDSGDRDQENCMRVRSGVSCSGHPLQSEREWGERDATGARKTLSVLPRSAKKRFGRGSKVGASGSGKETRFLRCTLV